MRNAILTVDVERDIPPYPPAASSQGIIDRVIHAGPYRDITYSSLSALSFITELCSKLDINATFFLSGEVLSTDVYQLMDMSEIALRKKAISEHAQEHASGFSPTVLDKNIDRIISSGSEIGFHGLKHDDPLGKTRQEFETEIEAGIDLLKKRTGVRPVSFRAPYLRFPVEFLQILNEHRFRVDSSLFRPGKRAETYIENGILRVPCTLNPAYLRFPPLIRTIFPAPLYSLQVIMVHPWELIDLTKFDVNPLVKFNCGKNMRKNLEMHLRTLKKKGYNFCTMGQMYNLLA